jgi:hypothetical protein
MYLHYHFSSILLKIKLQIEQSKKVYDNRILPCVKVNENHITTKE